MKDEIKLLIVDDSTSNVDMLFRLFGDQYQVFVATDGKSTLSLLDQIHIDVILLDLILPDTHGNELLKEIRRKPEYEKIPVIVISGVQDEKEIQQVRLMDIQGFHPKPIDREKLKKAVENLNLAKTSDMENTEENKFSLDPVELLQGYLHLADMVSHIKSPSPSRHHLSISWTSLILAKSINLDKNQCYYVFLASPLRDIGLLHIPKSILQKKGTLNYEEWVIIQKHTKDGLDFLQLDNPIFSSASQIARQHHEHWDGNGYPGKLRGEEISIESRIVALSDTLDSLLSQRHYRNACTFDQAMEALKQGEGTRYDPYLIKHLFECRSELEKHYRKLFTPAAERKMLADLGKDI